MQQAGFGYNTGGHAFVRLFDCRFRKIYLVHIRALVPLYQTNTYKRTHVLLNRHFINLLTYLLHGAESFLRS
jgi:hypothetical protein